MSSLQKLSDAGVSIWLDDLSRERLESGSLAALIEGSNVVGVTTNPSIFSAAISGSEKYSADIKKLASQGASIADIVTKLTTDDVRNACDLFAPTFEATLGVDGRVSIEVDPELAYNAEATIARGLQLAALVNRPNLLIKVPATLEGLPAIEELTARGISVNVTLIFSVERYEAVMDSYLRGLERRIGKGEAIDQIHSVASFFISRIDAEIDKQLDGTTPNSPLRGVTAIANAHVAYNAYLKVLQSARVQAIHSHGGHMQRPLWASTGVKDKAYDSTRYVVELVAANCVNTMPEGTLNEVRAHGEVKGNTITSNITRSEEQISQLAGAGIDLAAVTEHLEVDGVKKFIAAWEELLANIANIARVAQA